MQSQEVEDALRYLSEADLASLTQELAAGNA